MLQLVAIAGAAFVARESFTAFVRRRRERQIGYAAALKKAQATGRPLMVVGDPDSGFITKFFGRDYGCGDVCTDLNGCSGCPVEIRAPLETGLYRVPRESHVVFVSLTCEYVDDLHRVIDELERVAIPGGLFVTTVDPTHLSTWWLYGAPKWVLHDAPFGDHTRWEYQPYRRPF